MTNKEKKDWLSVKYPLTVICDRYDGTYSGAKWLAFPLPYSYIPSGISASDFACANFWKGYKEPVGKGDYASDAVTDLIRQMNTEEPEESGDERIRKAIVCGMNVLKEQKKETFAAVPINDCLAWLEKQKDILGERAKNITANMFEDGIKGIQRELIEFLSNTVNASWVDIIRSADAYAERIRNTIKKQKEQKPSINIDQLKSLMLQYLQEAANEKDDLSIEADTDKWARKILGYDFEQKPAEWSEEDEDMLNSCISSIEEAKENRYAYKETDGDTSYDREINWLKSLRPQPQWKPSEEQIQTLIKIHGNSDMPTQQILGSLITVLNNLKKL